ncbi:GNAT family N-acetyltransferase [Pedobacter sandarakinus]|uniref:GNAT family N-acetyltransferase n=1 Tax=Pedobacter sandarakinus TaxID=353156 RepID=UPI0022469EFD|nr:GNAT family N-acetyltransferase [Pedobacter sandarakinus]MCX2574312.1 GNAT family N-acetyltransferase [Pedobacter sandarakinus]
MNTEIYLRPLVLADAATSFKWRNDPEVWSYTKFVLQSEITHQIEREWLSKKMKLPNERRFAICLKQDDAYIGNIQLLNITAESADFHLFIGEKIHWGKGYGYQASTMLIQYAFSTLHLKNIALEVHADHAAAYSIYKKAGFKRISETDGFIKMAIDAPTLHASAL